MVVKKVHCFFEQSGTFKNEFIKLGIEAEDYDIQNDFGQTDHVIDLFKEIEKAYSNFPSIFDRIEKDELIFAFFPCIYFCAYSQMAMYYGCKNYRKKTIKETTDLILKRSENREKYFRLAVMLVSIVKNRGGQLIMENPWSEQTFLKSNFVMPPTIIDKNRMLRGDYYKKPTAYWFVGCTPTSGKSYQKDKKKKTISKAKGSKQAGLCSLERSLISEDYARNFICDFILGKEQEGFTIPLLFKDM